MARSGSGTAAQLTLPAGTIRDRARVRRRRSGRETRSPRHAKRGSRGNEEAGHRRARRQRGGCYEAGGRRRGRGRVRVGRRGAGARRGRRRRGLRQVRADRAAGPRGPQPAHRRARRHRPIFRGVVQGREGAEGRAEFTGAGVVAMANGSRGRVRACGSRHRCPNHRTRPR